MQFSFLIGALAIGALAEPILPQLLQRAYTTSCMTRSSCEPGPKTLKTTYTTSCATTTSTKLVTVTSTSIPSATKTTVFTSTVSTTTTAPAATLTATSTQTTTNTVFVTTTSSVTTTTTSTSSTTVSSTVPISTAFDPVQSTIPGSSYRGSGVSPAKRDTEALQERGTSGGPPAAAKKASYPQGVNCVVYSKSTATSTKTVTSFVQGASMTVSSTTTTTLTSTVYPSATTTVTTDTTVLTTSTQTTSTTTTATTTITTTSVVPYYAACAQNNIVDSVNNFYIIAGFDETGEYSFSSSKLTTAYDCCVFAYTNPAGNPAHWLFIPSYSPSNNCFAYSATSCSAGQQSNTKEIYYTSGGTAAGAWSLGQFQCGVWDSSTQLG